MMTDLHPRARQLIDLTVDGSSPQDGADELAALFATFTAHGRQAHFAYWDMRTAGQSARLAEMLALGAPPMSNTDREFLEGRCNGNQFDGGPLRQDIGDRFRKVAEAAGQSVKGKVYIGGLARFPGDPHAWVSDRGDVKRIVEGRGWKCEGSVEVNNGSFALERSAEFRERKPAPGPGLDRDEDGHVAVNEGPCREVVDKKLEAA